MEAQISVAGLDIAKSVFQVHAADASGKAVMRRKLRREEVENFFRTLPPCLVGLEACPSSHFWARLLRSLGHDVRLLPAQYVRPYVKTNKNDAADAEAICETVTRPTMRFVPIKEEMQQEVLVLHRVREMLIRQRTQLINSIRGHLAEFGIIAPNRARQGTRDGNDPGGGRTFLKADRNGTQDDLRATKRFRWRFRNWRTDDNRRELYRILRCWEDQLALPRHRPPSGEAVGSQSIALRNFIDFRARS